MERLTKRVSATCIELSSECNPIGFCNCPQRVYNTHNYWNVFKRLADYEDAEEQGLLLRLPCKVGDTVWGLIRFSGGGRVPSWYELCRYTFTLSMFQEIGKTVFLTREEAESALAEKGGAE